MQDKLDNFDSTNWFGCGDLTQKLESLGGYPEDLLSFNSVITTSRRDEICSFEAFFDDPFANQRSHEAQYPLLLTEPGFVDVAYFDLDPLFNADMDHKGVREILSDDPEGESGHLNP